MIEDLYSKIFTEYPDVVTIDDIMEMLHVGKNTAYGLVKDGLIKSIRRGDRYIVPKACVIEFLQTAS